MKVLVLASFILLVTSQFTEIEYQNAFVQWKTQFRRVYQDENEENSKFQTFKTNYNKIHEINQKGLAWEAGLGRFSDWTKEEFKAQYLMAPQHCSATNSFPLLKSNGQTVGSMDWRDKSIVSPVKDQGNCGSCWTFSTAGAMEAHWAIYSKQTFGGSGKAPLLSEQQLVDCASDFNNFGCDGGLPSQAFEYLKYAGGQDSEKQYPYTARTGRKCKTVEPFAATIKGGSVNMTDENDILFHLTNVGPISIAYDCTDNFMHYTKGVYHEDNCGASPQEVNHAVLAVGFGTDTKTGLDYWIVKNSWSTDWGMDGYFWIQRGVNMCGLADCASFPDIAGVYERV